MRAPLKKKDLKKIEKAKFKIRWTRKKVLIAGGLVILVYGSIVAYIISAINIPIGLLIVLIAMPIIVFGGYYLLYVFAKNLS